MAVKDQRQEADRLDQVLAEARRSREAREVSYRGRALKLFPHVCGRCGREFEGRRLRELTVHHKDHNHDNNPPDGSNWELLCMYCHDMEHARYVDESADDELTRTGEQDRGPGYRPFADLANLLKNKK
jgi:hypothetical protein